MLYSTQGTIIRNVEQFSNFTPKCDLSKYPLPHGIKYNPQKWNGTDKDKLSNNYALQYSHNCYSYLLNNIDQSKIRECAELLKKEKIDRLNNEDSQEIEDICSDLKAIPGNYYNSLPEYEKRHIRELVKNKSDNYKNFICPIDNFSDIDYEDNLENICHNFKTRILCDNPEIEIVDFDTPCKKNYYKGAITIDNEPDKEDGDDVDFHFYRQNLDGTYSHKSGHTKAINEEDNKMICEPGNLHNTTDTRYNSFCTYMCVPNKKTNAL